MTRRYARAVPLMPIGRGWQPLVFSLCCPAWSWFPSRPPPWPGEVLSAARSYYEPPGLLPHTASSLSCLSRSPSATCGTELRPRCGPSNDWSWILSRKDLHLNGDDTFELGEPGASIAGRRPP